MPSGAAVPSSLPAARPSDSATPATAAAAAAAAPTLQEDTDRSAEGLTFEQWEEASWAPIDAIELELGDDALALQRKAKAKRRKERVRGGGGAAGASSGWRGEQALSPKPPDIGRRGHAARAPVMFGLAKKKPAKVRAVRRRAAAATLR
jgi:hypothetical protein